MAQEISIIICPVCKRKYDSKGAHFIYEELGSCEHFANEIK